MFHRFFRIKGYSAPTPRVSIVGNKCTTWHSRRGVRNRWDSTILIFFKNKTILSYDIPSILSRGIPILTRLSPAPPPTVWKVGRQQEQPYNNLLSFRILYISSILSGVVLCLASVRLRGEEGGCVRRGAARAGAGSSQNLRGKLFHGDSCSSTLQQQAATPGQ